MSAPKLTRWFSAGERPVRDGVYQRKYSDGVFYSKWQCERWYIGNSSLEAASATRGGSGMQFLEWRGLAEQPKEQS